MSLCEMRDSLSLSPLVVGSLCLLWCRLCIRACVGKNERERKREREREKEREKERGSMCKSTTRPALPVEKQKQPGSRPALGVKSSAQIVQSLINCTNSHIHTKLPIGKWQLAILLLLSLLEKSRMEKYRIVKARKVKKKKKKKVQNPKSAVVSLGGQAIKRVSAREDYRRSNDSVDRLAAHGHTQLN